VLGLTVLASTGLNCADLGFLRSRLGLAGCVDKDKSGRRQRTRKDSCVARGGVESAGGVFDSLLTRVVLDTSLSGCLCALLTIFASRTFTIERMTKSRWHYSETVYPKFTIKLK